MKTMYVLSSAFLLLLASCNSDQPQTVEKIVYRDRADVQTTTPSKTEVKQNDQASITKQRAVEFNSDFSNFNDFRDNLNKHIIHAELNGNQGEFTLLCETQSSPHDKKKFQKQFGTESLSADLLIDLNDIVAQKETLHCSIESDTSTILEANFEIKKDLLISESGDIQKKMVAGKNEFGALVLSEGVVLETLGTNLNLKIDQFITSEATIATFDQEKNIKASDNQDGLSGGILNINARQAFGNLTIKMRGQNGGSVTETPRKIEERPLIDASFNGLPMITEWQESCDDRYDRPICDGWRTATQCPTDGKKGIKGFKGRKGYDGRAGGNSGVANINIADGTLFTLEMSLKNGLGSLPGLPGIGGPGSIGGAAGTYDGAYLDSCGNRAPTAGAPGDNGDNGDSGNPGKDGQKERASYLDLKNNVKIEY